MQLRPQNELVLGQLFVALKSFAGAMLIAGTVFASMVGVLDAYVINVAVAAIGRTFGATVAELQWTVTGYLVTVASLLLLAGALADRFGWRRLLEVGLVIQLAGGLSCATAPSIQLLLVARLLQGVGGAMVIPSSLALLNGSLSPNQRARGIGIWAGLASLGSTLGPFVGGWLVDHGSWRWVFVLNVPIILLSLIALQFVREGNTVRHVLSVDVAGALLTCLGLGGVVYGFTTGPSSGWSNPLVLTALLVGLLCLIVLVPVERLQSAPMLRFYLFRSQQFDALNVATIFLYGAAAAATYLLVLQCELRLGYSAAAAGAVLIPQTAAFLVISPLCGQFLPKIGPRKLIVTGCLAIAVSFFWLSHITRGDYSGSILFGVLLWGVGLGLLVTPLTASVLGAVWDTDLGEASATNNAASRVGGVVVIALVPVLIGATGHRSLGQSLVTGYRPAMMVLGCLALIAGAISAAFVRNGQAVTAVVHAPVPQVHCCAVALKGNTEEASNAP